MVARRLARDDEMSSFYIDDGCLAIVIENIANRNQEGRMTQVWRVFRKGLGVVDPICLRNFFSEKEADEFMGELRKNLSLLQLQHDFPLTKDFIVVHGERPKEET